MSIYIYVCVQRERDGGGLDDQLPFWRGRSSDGKAHYRWDSDRTVVSTAQGNGTVMKTV